LTLSIPVYPCQVVSLPSTLSSRLSRPAVEPERTRISYIAALTVATFAAFSKESRMKFANAANLDRKSGVAQWRDLLFHFRAQRIQVGGGEAGSSGSHGCDVSYQGTASAGPLKSARRGL
jgi:hypothetical protein